MANEEFVLTQEEMLHKQFMRAILKSVADTPLVLKGGTALMLAYGLDRFSEDLDFDAPHKLHLESKIRHSARYGISIEDLKLQKDTDTVTRYRIRYKTKVGARTLLVEVSYRTEVAESDVKTHDGIRVYSIAKIVDQKLLAAHDGEHPRTVIRDLYDIDFIARKFPDIFAPELAARLLAFAANPDDLLSRYQQAYQEDVLVQNKIPLEYLVIGLSEIASALIKNTN